MNDLTKFQDRLNAPEQAGHPHLRKFFAHDRDIFIARAPGRLDVMGGIADYSGSLVLQLPLKEATFAAIQRTPDRLLRIVSLPAEAAEEPRMFEMDLAEFESDGRPVSYDIARKYFRRDPASSWAAYIAGAFLVLMREKQAAFPKGARLLIDSAVPEGKGVSSSAALEVAAMRAVAAAFGIEVPPQELAALCQIVENRIVGAACGIMDQMTATCGQEGRLLSLLCQPAQLNQPLPIPEEISFWGIDSGVSHAVAGSAYTNVRVGAFMGYRMIADMAGLDVKKLDAAGHVRIDDPEWHGYLANIGPEAYERRFAPRLPETIPGSEFLSKFQGTSDPVTTIDPDATYPVRNPTRHPVYEHARVQRFAQLLPDAGAAEVCLEMGELMYAAHAGYSACGLGADQTDRLVALAREAGQASGIYGAKITGGGSGGTVAILGRADAGDAVTAIAGRYARETGTAGRIFSGSSDGAGKFGCFVWRDLLKTEK